MSYTSEDWRQAVTRLLEMTSRNEVNWEPSDLDRGDSWTWIDGSFSTRLGDRTFVISKTRSRYYLDENEWVWQGGYHFAIYLMDGTGDHQQIATAPAIGSLSALYDAAEGNLAFNRNALGGLLG